MNTKTKISVLILMGFLAVTSCGKKETAPAEQPQEGGDPIQQLVAVIMQLGDMAAQALQSQDPNSMGQVCEALAQFANEISQQMGGAAQPKFKKGGKFAGKKMIPQKACGSKMK